MVGADSAFNFFRFRLPDSPIKSGNDGEVGWVGIWPERHFSR